MVLGFNEVNKNKREECQKLVSELIPSAKEDMQTAYNTLKFLLPQSEVAKFGELFKKLEGTCTLSVKMSNLEDAFIKLGEECESNEAAIINDTELRLPESECRYSFSRQFRAVFTRKFTTTFRSLGAVVSLLLPIIFILLGVLMSCVLIDGDGPV